MVEAGLIAFSNACFEFENEDPEVAQHGSLANFPKILASHLHRLPKVIVVEFCT